MKATLLAVTWTFLVMACGTSGLVTDESTEAVNGVSRGKSIALKLAQTAPAQEPAPKPYISTSSIPGPPDWQNLYVGDFGKGCIYKIAPDGEATVYADGVPAPGQLVFDKDGTLFVAGGDSIWEITPTPDGSPATRKNGHLRAFVSGLHHAKALTRDLVGNFWVTEYYVRRILDEDGRPYDPPRFEHGGLYKIAPDGTKITIDSPLQWPYGLTSGPDGNVCLAQLSGFRILKYTPEGEATVLARGIYWLRNVAFGPDGLLYALGGNGISTVTPDGTVSEFCNWKKDGFRGIHQVGLAFDANGTLYSTACAEKPRTEDSTGYIYQHGPEGKHRLLAKVGIQPFFLAFYPTEAPTGAGARHIAPSDPDATPEVQRLLANLHRVRGRKIIFGHHMTTQFHVTTPPSGAARWSDIKAATGEWPGMWSFQMNFATRYGKADRMRENIRFAHELGAPITMCWHMVNPVTGRPRDRDVDIASLLPGGENHHLLVERLSRGADYLETLTDSRGRLIPIFFRPWHEFTLRGTWWNTTPELFIKFYRFTVDYFRNRRGLHNLLYVYTPNYRRSLVRGDIAANFMHYYPGDRYVDVLSMDYYGPLSREGLRDVLREIIRLADEHGKLPALHETGVEIGRGYARPDADPDWYAGLLDLLKTEPVSRQLSYATTWYNKPHQYWVPYADGVRGFEAFRRFYADPYTAFGNDVQAMDLYGRKE